MHITSMTVSVGDLKEAAHLLNFVKGSSSVDAVVDTPDTAAATEDTSAADALAAKKTKRAVDKKAAAAAKAKAADQEAEEQPAVEDNKDDADDADEPAKNITDLRKAMADHKKQFGNNKALQPVFSDRGAKTLPDLDEKHYGEVITLIQNRIAADKGDDRTDEL